MLGLQQQEQGAINTIEQLRAQAGFYRLCGRLLEGEIDHDLLLLLRGELREPLAEIGVVASDGFFNDPEPAVLEAMAEEFTGLLVAPGAMMPYASVFETGRMFQQPADRAAAAYQQAGWRFQHRMSGEFPDHIGVMLSFYALLLDAQAGALERDDRASADLSCEQAERCLVELLAPWAPGWCRLAAKAALNPFYRQLLAALEQSLWLEISDRALSRETLKELAALNNREPPRLDYDADFRKASGL